MLKALLFIESASIPCCEVLMCKLCDENEQIFNESKMSSFPVA